MSFIFCTLCCCSISWLFFISPLTFYMASFWLRKLVVCKCCHHCGVGSEHGPATSFQFPFCLQDCAQLQRKKFIFLVDFADVLMQSPGLLSPGKSPSQWPQLPWCVKCYCMQVSTLLYMCHVKNLCYSCIFCSQERVALNAATITCKITWCILKSVNIKKDLLLLLVHLELHRYSEQLLL